MVFSVTQQTSISQSSFAVGNIGPYLHLAVLHSSLSTAEIKGGWIIKEQDGQESNWNGNSHSKKIQNLAVAFLKH